MAIETLSQRQTKWHTILGQIFRPEMLAFFPDKVFLVEKNGTYHDYFYPLPCLHLLNGQSLIGKNLQDIFPQPIHQAIKRHFREVERTRRFTSLWIKSPRPEHSIHHIHLTIMTLETRFLMFAKDYTATGMPLLNLRLDSPQMHTLRQHLWPFLSSTPEGVSERIDQTATDR